MELEGIDGKWERETVIQFCDGEPGVVRVWTAQRRVGTWLEKVCAKYSVNLKRGTNRMTWEAIIPSKCVKLSNPAKEKRVLSPAQKEAMAANLIKARDARNAMG